MSEDADISPYAPPQTALARPRYAPSTTHRLARSILLGCTYPLLLIGSTYAAWFCGWVELGHQPEPWVDDPTQLEGISGLFQFMGWMLFLAFLPAIVITTGVWFYTVSTHSRLEPNEREYAISLAVGLPVAWLALFGLFALDPFEARVWFFAD